MHVFRDYLDTHDQHDAQVNQWMEDTDHVLQTQARQNSALALLVTTQTILLKDQKLKAEALEAKMEPLFEAMKAVQEAVEQLPAMQEKLVRC